ncbi:MAG: hypothetical protein LBU13_08375 [Synergistaceae bacterium]|nr:hypothetical protein [Synergistaceae bacterium]
MVVLALSVSSRGFAAGEEFVGGIGGLSPEEQVINWFHNIAPTEGIVRYNGPITNVSAEDIISFEEVYNILGVETTIVPQGRTSTLTSAFAGEQRSAYEEAQENNLLQSSTTKPTINPPTPITNRLVDESGFRSYVFFKKFCHQ